MYKIVKKEYIKALEDEVKNTERDRVRTEKALRGKLENIEKVLLYIREKQPNKKEILELVQTVLEDEYYYESDQ